MQTWMRFGWGKALLAITGIVGALMLIPSDGTVATATTGPKLSALATSPALASFLDDAVDTSPAARTSKQVIAEVAAAPEPGLPPVLAKPSAAVITTAALENAVPRQTTTARSPVNMRSGPSTDHATLFVLQADEAVTIVAKDGGWAKVEKRDGTSGWVFERYLGTGGSVDEPKRKKPILEAKAREDSVATRGSVSTGGNVRLRDGPYAMSEVILVIPPGTPLRIAEQRGGYLRVVLPDGNSGWIRGRV